MLARIVLMTAFSAFTLAFALPAHASLYNYECEIILVTKTFSLDEKMQVPSTENTSHGGQEFSYKKGTDVVEGSADSKWIDVQWTRNGKLVAAGLFAIAGETEFHRVGIIYNPAAPDDEQVSVGCAPVLK